MSNNLHKGHRSRMRERYKKEGLDFFADHQILEFLLFYCYPQKDTNEIAHKMLKEFGSLPNLFEAKTEEIILRCKCSENVAVLLSLISQLSRKYFKSRWAQRPIFDNTRDLANYIKTLFIGRKYECFMLVCLDTKYKLINSVLVHDGTIDSAAVYPRNVIEAALYNQAATVAFCHNHPSGDLRPSQSDIDLTKKLIRAFSFIDVDVLDHVIVAGNEYFSFSEHKLLNLTF